MKVLVACEHSGAVRDAFTRKGHDATSCDLLPNETPGKHFLGDVREILHEGWDLMIAHPPCTYLAYSGAAHWNKPGRAELRAEALAFFIELYNAPIPRVCIENPKGWPGQAFKPASQYVNPYDFGQPIRKRTGLWLRNLPLLIRRDFVPPPPAKYIEKATGKKRHFTDSVGGGPNQWKKRSATFGAIAEAMAEQWGDNRIHRLGQQTELF